MCQPRKTLFCDLCNGKVFNSIESLRLHLRIHAATLFGESEPTPILKENKLPSRKSNTRRSSRIEQNQVQKSEKSTLKEPKTPKKTKPASREPRTPNKEPKTPKKEPKTPKKEPKTPKKEPKTPPKKESKTPKKKLKTPKKEPKTPSRKDPIVCKICSEMFSLRSAYVKHLKNHKDNILTKDTPEEVHRCKECTRNFAKKHHLAMHMRVHKK